MMKMTIEEKEKIFNEYEELLEESRTTTIPKKFTEGKDYLCEKYGLTRNEVKVIIDEVDSLRKDRMEKERVEKILDQEKKNLQFYINELDKIYNSDIDKFDGKKYTKRFETFVKSVSNAYLCVDKIFNWVDIVLYPIEDTTPFYKSSIFDVDVIRNNSEMIINIKELKNNIEKRKQYLLDKLKVIENFDYDSYMDKKKSLEEEKSVLMNKMKELNKSFPFCLENENIKFKM